MLDAERNCAMLRALMLHRCLITLFSLLAFVGTPVLAHELWIAPERYQVEPGGKIQAHIRVGNRLVGPPNSYLPDNFTRFEIVMGDKSFPVKGRLGDVPILQMTAPREGLAVAVYQSTKSNVHYLKWEKFAKFAKRKGFPETLEQHKARGLPDKEFFEAYRRFAKSLIAIGHGRGADRELGMETEFVAEANPYLDDLSGGFPVRLLYQGKPRADAQIEIFARDPDGEVTLTKTSTGADGRAKIPVQPGHEYLLDAVVMRPLEGRPAEREAVWETLWAGLSFKVPAKN